MAVLSSLERELVFLILQFLDEEKYKDAVHKLEQESGVFFNMKYFEEEVQNGKWDEVEHYLSGFTKFGDNRYSTKLFFEIRKHKYLEALDKHDYAKAVEILVKDLKVFVPFNEEIFKEFTQLLTQEDFRDNEQLSNYGDTKSARTILVAELKKLIELNPLFRDKLNFPDIKNSRLRILLNQSISWQHYFCEKSVPYPDMRTLFFDHSCDQPNGTRAPSPTSSGRMLISGGLSPLVANRLFRPTATPVPAPLAGWMSNSSTGKHPAVLEGANRLIPSTNPAAVFQLPRTPTNKPVLDNPSPSSDQVSKRTGPIGISDKVTHPLGMLPVKYPDQNRSQGLCLPNDLPKTVVRTLNQGLPPKSMDFHPVQQTILLVGTNVGDIGLWEVESEQRLFQKNFMVWDLGACSLALQEALVKDPVVSINRIMWSPDGTLFGVAYSRHIVQIYSYRGVDDIQQHLELEAHIGGVNDLSFSHPGMKLCVITCGDDKTIKVWDAATGAKLHTLEGHEAPVYSVYPHSKGTVQFIFSTSLDEKIKAWLYDKQGAVVDYDAPGYWHAKMAYCADGSRLFSGGTSKSGESFLVEWSESEGTIKRTYQGFQKCCSGVLQFDTTRNRLLAAGHDFSVKFWNMDNVNLLTTIAADGNLPACPCIRFNKEGTLLAVSTNDNGIKILANLDGLKFLRTSESCSFSISVTKPQVNPVAADPAASAVHTVRIASAVDLAGMNGETRKLVDVKPRLTDEPFEILKTWKLTEINVPVQCRSLRLHGEIRTSKISRLIYTNSGVAILALTSNATHLLWKWQQNDRNTNGKATSSVAPILWQPPSGILMTNDITDANPEEGLSCLTLSRNDSYLMSASGGKVSLFNMITFKRMTRFMHVPPAATFLAFDPKDNNIIAIGLDDSTIHIYNVRIDEVRGHLKGHSKRITGLSFSHVLDVLVSSGADAQLCVWGTNRWEKQRSRTLQIPGGRTPKALSETHVQFHQDQIHFLAVHETQICIYETTKLECLKQWVPCESSAPISHATFSCNSQLVYASFLDATVFIFSAANLRLQCRINPAAYLPADISSTVSPVVIAAHPSEPNQFALGMTDGAIHVVEPLESEGKWGMPPPVKNGSVSSMSTTSAAKASCSEPQNLCDIKL